MFIMFINDWQSFHLLCQKTTTTITTIVSPYLIDLVLRGQSLILYTQ